MPRKRLNVKIAAKVNAVSICGIKLTIHIRNVFHIDKKNTLCYRAYSELFHREEKADLEKEKFTDMPEELQEKHQFI